MVILRFFLTAILKWTRLKKKISLILPKENFTSIGTVIYYKIKYFFFYIRRHEKFNLHLNNHGVEILEQFFFYFNENELIYFGNFKFISLPK